VTSNDSNPGDESPALGGLRLHAQADSQAGADVIASAVVIEVGGRGGLDPTRYGDWELKGRCIDF
jgi:hypothetical protein